MQMLRKLPFAEFMGVLYLFVLVQLLATGLLVF
jgi:hypothetical protein